MAVGQGVLAGSLDVAALNSCEGRVELLALDRCAAHGARLRTVLALHSIFVVAGCRESTTAQLALLEQTSEQAASALLEQALLLSSLPGGLDAVECGLLSEAQAAAVVRRLSPADDAVRAVVWRQLQGRLLSAFEQSVVLAPARLADLVGGWVVAADGAAATERRRAAARDGGVTWSRRDDGLVDLSLFGLAGPDAQAVLSRIRDRSRPWGPDDDRTAGARRRDAMVALLLGRDQQPLRESQDPFHDDSAGSRCVSPAVAAGGAPCGCRNGEPVPCGIGVTLLLPLGAALGTTDEVAVLVGHGPIEPDLAQAVLHTAPVIRPVWVDEHGVPVAVGDRTSSPPRGDPAAVRETLLRLAASQPPRLHPRHPDDHGPPDDVHFREPHGGPSREAGDDRRTVRTGWWERPLRLPRLLTRPHPQGTPGAYRPSTRLTRLIHARAPRCEWPGCGAWAQRCDLDHDVAHPHGATCACQMGPACRRHHRLKQLLWTKARRSDGVHWTGPTGRSWLSPGQSAAPQAPVRPLPALPDLRGPGAPSLDEDPLTDIAWLSGRADRLVVEEHLPDDDPDEEAFRRALDDPWGLVLDDPTRWDCHTVGGDLTAAPGPRA